MFWKQFWVFCDAVLASNNVGNTYQKQSVCARREQLFSNFSGNLPVEPGHLVHLHEIFHQDLRNWSLETLTFTSPPPSFTSQLFSGIVNCCTRVIWYFTRVTRYSLGHHWVVPGPSISYIDRLDAHRVDGEGQHPLPSPSLLWHPSDSKLSLQRPSANSFKKKHLSNYQPGTQKIVPFTWKRW